METTTNEASTLESYTIAEITEIENSYDLETTVEYYVTTTLETTPTYDENTNERTVDFETTNAETTYISDITTMNADTTNDLEIITPGNVTINMNKTENNADNLKNEKGKQKFTTY